ncbi:restriction endonuclease, SacI family [Ancylobacter sp. IITR112]|uniref:restriction endonuclease, SacI family n=1 Tax=Ancylobacter sp. IITR112 TaxID=3138073 RepID=UPI003529EEB9
MAERVLRDEAAKADNDPGDQAWIAYIEQLSDLCERSRIRTHIAFLGTAILARAVDARADLKWIKPAHAVNAPHAFSARTLAEKVLVPVAADLGIHLGVTSPQPLNNQPYFRMTYLGDETPISAGGRAPFDFMVELIAKLEKMSSAQSRDALRAFVSVRRRYQPRYTDQPGELSVTPDSLAAAILAFLSAGSEGGKRAQACVAGLFDAAFGSEHVESGRINDPSRDHPGDVCVIYNGVVVKAIEVKDKPVSFNDVQIFGKKAIDMGATDATYVMVATQQERLDDTRLGSWADGFGLSLTLFYDWNSLIHQSLYWAATPKREAAKFAAIRIRDRLVAVEAHPDSIQRWDAELQTLRGATTP